MEQKRLCPYCMGELPHAADSCVHCGKVFAGRNPAGCLPVGTVLAGRYTVGEMQSLDGEGILYRGVENLGCFRVTIKEYLPVTLSAERGADCILQPKTGSEVLFKTTRMDFADLYRALERITPATGLEAVLDVVYNPARTALMLQAEQLGIPHASGLSMLVAQAKKACEYFTGNPVPDAEIDRIERLLSRQMENIILIGMPGCGKSSVGKALAAALNRTFLDADEEIVRRAGCSIPEIFAAQAEAGFRRLESAVLADLGKQSGIVLATGGGCVTRPENYPSLHQNGCIVWLTRDLSLLPTDGRPVSQANPLEALWETRKALYEQFSDVTVRNDTTIDACVQQIEEALL